MAVKRFLGPGTPALHAYSDNSKEIIAAMEQMQILHDTSTPYCHESNGVIERAGRRVKEGTAACLVQSGLNEIFWDLATKCYCFLRNVVDLLLDGETAWKKRFGVDYNGPIWPFGCEVLYKPHNPEMKNEFTNTATNYWPGYLSGTIKNLVVVGAETFS